MTFLGAFIGALFMSAIVVFLAGLLGGLALMLLLGVLNAEISASVPTLGYWTSVVIMMLTGSVLRLLMWPSAQTKK